MNGMRPTVFAAALFAMVMPSVAQAQFRDIDVNRAMIPFIYSYAACIFDPSEKNVETRIEQCAGLRAEIEAQYESLSLDWQRPNQPAARRMFLRALQLMELEAHYSQENRVPAPASTIRYLACIGENARKDRNFTAGVFLDFNRLDRECRKLRADDLTGDAADLENRLYHRFQIHGLTYAPLQSSLPVITYRYGLFEPR